MVAAIDGQWSENMILLAEWKGEEKGKTCGGQIQCWQRQLSTDGSGGSAIIVKPLFFEEFFDINYYFTQPIPEGLG